MSHRSKRRCLGIDTCWDASSYYYQAFIGLVVWTLAPYPQFTDGGSYMAKFKNALTEFRTTSGELDLSITNAIGVAGFSLVS